jgi:D-alanyl-D-alanine carboxypeptidase (penicillin-binding protein 5/6)
MDDSVTNRGAAVTAQHDAPDALSDLTALMQAEQDLPARGDGIDPRIRRIRRRRALTVTLGIVVAAVMVVGGYVGWALNAPLSAPAVVSQAPAAVVPAAAALDVPSQGASAISVAGADEYLGAAASGIWATSGTDEARSIGSISKLITALVVLDAHPLANAEDPGPTITFDKADHDLYDAYYVRGATIAAMPTGSSMSLHDALATMLIPSASNYADAVSTWAFGSPGAFVNAARSWLSAQGLADTRIVEPTGIDPRNTSTPGDLIAIGKLAAAHPVLAQIVATRSLSLPGPGAMVNTNDLLGTAGVTGLKTGNLGAGSYNLLYTASVDVGTGTPLSITGVLLGGLTHDSVNAGVVGLLQSIDAGFHTVTVATAGQEVGSFSTPWGGSARMVLGGAASILTWSDTPITVTMETRTPTDYTDGEVVGTVTWTAGPRTATAPVTIAGNIDPPTDWWRLTHPDQLGAFCLPPLLACR